MISPVETHHPLRHPVVRQLETFRRATLSLPRAAIATVSSLSEYTPCTPYCFPLLWHQGWQSRCHSPRRTPRVHPRVRRNTHRLLPLVDGISALRRAAHETLRLRQTLGQGMAGGWVGVRERIYGIETAAMFGRREGCSGEDLRSAG